MFEIKLYIISKSVRVDWKVILFVCLFALFTKGSIVIDLFDSKLH